MTRPLVVAIPSYGRPGPLQETVAGVRTHVQPDTIFLYAQDAPVGAGAARRELCRRAVDAYGPAVDVLMLDDDVVFSGESEPDRFRRAAAPLRAGAGIVQLPNRATPSGAKARPAVPAYHAFILAGEMLASGVTYDAEEYGDDVAMSLIAYFAGWPVVVSGEVCVRHHVSRRGVVGSIGGGIEASHRDGVPVVCRLFPAWREVGWVTYDEGERAGVKLPTPYTSVRVTPEGRAAHGRARRARTA